MQQHERTSRSRARILEAALELFSTQGYHGTTTAQIADAAELSKGNVYHHFGDKAAIFRTLMEHYQEQLARPEFPINRVLLDGAFPDELERVGRAVLDGFEQERRYTLLVFVDAVEFEGRHLQPSYRSMAQRFVATLAESGRAEAVEAKLRPGLTVEFALMFTMRMFMQYATAEVSFGVDRFFGVATEEFLRRTADVVRHGILADP